LNAGGRPGYGPTVTAAVREMRDGKESIEFLVDIKTKKFIYGQIFD